MYSTKTFVVQMSAACTVVVGALVFVSLSFRCYAQPDAGAKTLAVCEAIEDVAKLEGQKVTVRGLYKATTHGAFLWPTAEPCEYTIVTPKIAWANRLSLRAAPRNDIDVSAMKEFSRQLKQERQTPDAYVVATFRGILRPLFPIDRIRYELSSSLAGRFRDIDSTAVELVFVSAFDVERAEEGRSWPRR